MQSGPARKIMVPFTAQGAALPNHLPAVPAARRGYWLVLALLVACAIAATSWPIFRTPQLEPDDYRYLHLAQKLDADFWGQIGRAGLVENRWDHLWFMDVPQRVCFFRPTIVLSYWLDAKLYGRERIAAGLATTNLLIYYAVCLLVGGVLTRWFGAGAAALLGTLFFTVHASHSELLWYIAGRTDSLAALGYLGALALHIAVAGRWRWLALPVFAFALLSKELTLSLPLVCLLHDAWLGEARGGWAAVLRRNAGLYAGYVVAALVVMVGRFAALSGCETALVFPYFVAPTRPDFWQYLGLEGRSYAENLLIGTTSPALVRLPAIASTLSAFGLGVSLLAAAGAAYLAYRDRRARVLLAMAALAWLPTSIVYLSERYLLLPSVALAGLLATAISVAGRRTPNSPTPAYYTFICVCALLWSGYHALLLGAKIEWTTRPRFTLATERRLRELKDQIPRGGRALALNLPGSWIDAQFAEDQFRWTLDDPDLRVRVLTLVPPAFSGRAGPQLRVLAENRFGLYAPPDAPPEAAVLDNRENPFETPPFTPGRRIAGERLGFEVRIISGYERVCTAAEFMLPDPLSGYTFVDLRDAK